MLQKFGKKVMNNFGLKILAVLFAVVLWIVVVNIDDPSNSKPYTTSVSLENKSYITSMENGQIIWMERIRSRSACMQNALCIIHLPMRTLQQRRMHRKLNMMRKQGLTVCRLS